MSILEDIDDIVNVLLGPAHVNTCRGSCERDISGKSSDIECLLHEFLAVILNSLPAIGAHERQVFEKLLWGLVSSTIFVRC